MQYDRCTAFWALLARVFREVADGSGLQGKKGYKWCVGSHKPASLQLTRDLRAGFWAAHQRCFRQLILSAKVPALARMAVEAVVVKKMAVVIGMQSTGEASTNKAMASDEDSELDDWISTPQQCVSSAPARNAD